MTGYIYAVGDCWSCGRQFVFNAELVPSIVVDGVREPVCRECVEKANEQRAQEGRELIVIFPDSYEPAEAGGFG